MNILVIQPGFPAEIPYFVRGLKRMGATVLGIGDQPEYMLNDIAKEGIDAYLQVRNLWQEEETVAAVRRWDIPIKLDRVECLWEPGMMLAARLREAFGLPGLTRQQTLIYRDKETMKSTLDRAGIRTPKHTRAHNAEEVRRAAHEIGFPIIVKPIAGAGSANTYRIENATALENTLPKLGGVKEVSVEEFISGREYTYDTICANGEVLYDNIAWYRPNVLIARSIESESPQTMTLNDMSSEACIKGQELGRKVLKALGFDTGFTHMEWFLNNQGEAIFGEIACRPPGGRSVELMNYGCDLDVFTGWAEAVVKGQLTQEVKRSYNAAVIFKRAKGRGVIRQIKGLPQIYAKYGEHIVCNNLSHIGMPRRDWKQTLVGDGYLIVRHKDLDVCCEIADHIADNLELIAR